MLWDIKSTFCWRKAMKSKKHYKQSGADLSKKRKSPEKILCRLEIKEIFFKVFAHVHQILGAMTMTAAINCNCLD